MHQTKGAAFANALESAGWERTRRISEAMIILSDTDIPTRAKTLDIYHRKGKKIFLYPHTARASLFHDFEGFTQSFPHTTSEFVVAPGHAEILRAIGIKHPLDAVGWSMCPMREFQPRVQYRKVLFAPIHPNADNSLCDVDKKINRDVLSLLITLVRSGDIDLTVRYVRDLDKNGLWTEPGVTYFKGELDLSYEQIDAADIVIAHQTFAYLSIARGVPTIMMGEDISPRVGSPIRGDFRFALTWDKYKHLLIYPYDILAESDTLALFRRAIASDAEITDWHRRLIGEPFDGKKFAAIVEGRL